MIEIGKVRVQLRCALTFLHKIKQLSSLRNKLMEQIHFTIPIEIKTLQKNNRILVIPKTVAK